MTEDKLFLTYNQQMKKCPLYLKHTTNLVKASLIMLNFIWIIISKFRLG